MLVHAPTVSNFRTIVISLVPVRERAVSCAMAQDRGAGVAVDHVIRSWNRLEPEPTNLGGDRRKSIMMC